MKIIIDRFEDKYAICEKENREMINIEISKIPSSAKEGDILIIDGNNIKVDKMATDKRKREIENLFNKLKNKK